MCYNSRETNINIDKNNSKYTIQFAGENKTSTDGQWQVQQSLQQGGLESKVSVEDVE